MMSEHDYLKPCPFCGTEQRQDWETRETIPYTNQSRSCHACGCSTHNWNRRPIEDALNARIAELRDVIGDYRNDVSRVLDEKCPSDERHCGCVPILRDQLNKYQKALILITTMPELSQATIIAREALQERGKFIWTEQSVGEYWVTKLDILQDKFDTLEKDYADVCQKRLEAADVFSRQIIELESENAELEAELAKMKEHFRQPTHGPCCTCQRCGQPYEDCRCDLDDVVDELEEAHARIAELEARAYGVREELSTRIAELEAEIDQLTAHDATERQDDKSPNDTQSSTFVYGKEREE